MNKQQLNDILSALPEGAIGVLGDFCTDVYWELHPELGERSIETGLTTTPITSARYSPGGAGNIVANLRGLGLKQIPCFGALGTDPFGEWLHRELVPCVDHPDFLLSISRQDYHTPVYCKPLLNGVEQSRLDLGNNPLTLEETDLLLDNLKQQLPNLRVLIINQQLKNGIHSEYFRKQFAALLQQTDTLPVIVFDGREHLTAYPKVTLKINAEAASRLAFGESGKPITECGKAIMKQTHKEMVITDGERGCHVFEPSQVTYIPAIPYHGPTDTVGAGDSFTAGFALGLACGASLKEAAELGNACAGITIRKINQTGVPTPDELFAILGN